MSSRPLRLALAAALLAPVLLAPRVARANGRFPATNQLVARPGDPQTMVLRSTYGVLVTRDGSAHWDWVCEKAVGYTGNMDPAIGVTGGGTILAGYFDGLSVSPDTGCNWNHVDANTDAGLDKQVVIDVVVRPATPSSGLAMTSSYAGQTDGGGPLFTSQIFASTDDGATWSPLGTAIDPTVLTETFDVAKSAPHRIYASGVRGSGSSEVGLLLVSNDDGTTWTQHTVPLDTTSERAPYIAAVDPTNADRVYIRTEGGGAGRLLVTDDGGATFRAVFTATGPIQGFALSTDGTTVFLGGPSDGLLSASSTALAFSKVSDVHVQCLAMTDAGLYACSDEVSGFVLGLSTDQGHTFAPKLHLNGLRGPLSCSSTSAQAQCVPDWPALRDTLGGSATDDGGTDGGGSGGDAAAPKDGGPVVGPDGGVTPTSDGGAILPNPPGRGCSCDSVGAGGGGAAGAGAAALLAWSASSLLRRRRAR